MLTTRILVMCVREVCDAENIAAVGGEDAVA